MIGGPMSRQSGEVVAPPPDVLTFGREGGFIYKLDRQASAGQRGVVYRYDKAATSAKLRAIGMPLELVAQATSDDTLAMLAAQGLIEREELAGIEVAVRIELHADEWRAFAADELVDTKPRDELSPDDHDSIKGWAEAIGREVADELRERNERAREAAEGATS